MSSYFISTFETSSVMILFRNTLHLRMCCWYPFSSPHREHKIFVCMYLCLQLVLQSVTRPRNACSMLNSLLENNILVIYFQVPKTPYTIYFTLRYVNVASITFDLAAVLCSSLLVLFIFKSSWTSLIRLQSLQMRSAKSPMVGSSFCEL